MNTVLWSSLGTREGENPDFCPLFQQQSCEAAGSRDSRCALAVSAPGRVRILFVKLFEVPCLFSFHKIMPNIPGYLC